MIHEKYCYPYINMLNSSYQMTNKSVLSPDYNFAPTHTISKEPERSIQWFERSIQLLTWISETTNNTRQYRAEIKLNRNIDPEPLIVASCFTWIEFGFVLKTSLWSRGKEIKVSFFSIQLFREKNYNLANFGDEGNFLK